MGTFNDCVFCALVKLKPLFFSALVRFLLKWRQHFKTSHKFSTGLRSCDHIPPAAPALPPVARVTNLLGSVLSSGPRKLTSPLCSSRWDFWWLWNLFRAFLSWLGAERRRYTTVATRWHRPADVCSDKNRFSLWHDEAFLQFLVKKRTSKLYWPRFRV